MAYQEWRKGITAEEELALFRQIARGKRADAAVKAATKAGSRALNAVRPQELRSEKTAGDEACARLAAAYADFADSRAAICHRKTGKRFDLGELRSHAMFALFPLLKRYKPDTGVPFTGYAAELLDREIMRLAHAEAVLVGKRALQEQRRRVHQTKAALEKRLGRQVSYEEVAAEHGINAVEAAHHLCWTEPVSIDALEEEAANEERRVAFPEVLACEPAGWQTGAAQRLAEAMESMAAFFGPQIAKSVGSGEQQRLIEQIRSAMDDEVAFVELQAWLLEKNRGREKPKTRSLAALPWRLLITAIGRSYLDSSISGPAVQLRKKASALPSGTGALERRVRRRQVVDGRSLLAIRETRGSV